MRSLPLRARCRNPRVTCKSDRINHRYKAMQIEFKVLLQFCPAERAWKRMSISTKVSKVKNEGPDLVECAVGAYKLSAAMRALMRGARTRQNPRRATDHQGSRS